MEDRPNYPKSAIPGLIRFFLLALLFWYPTVSAAETVRIASYNISLGRSGPGVLLKDILDGDDDQVLAAISVIQALDADILVLQEFDQDDYGFAADAFRVALNTGVTPINYPYFLQPKGNQGRPSELDLDGDGRTEEWADALGFGRFPGSEGILILSRYPFEAIRSFETLLLRDVPGTDLPLDDAGRPFPSAEAWDVLPMSYRSHVDVTVRIGDAKLTLLASHATPPVFDGPEDLNGIRNGAEIDFWRLYINGMSFRDDAGEDRPILDGAFVLLGDMNSDPDQGESLKQPIRSLLSDRLINDTRPSGGQGTNTANWDDPGPMRVDYVLPAASLTITGSGVFWPEPDQQIADLLTQVSRHYPVWVDVDFSDR